MGAGELTKAIASLAAIVSLAAPSGREIRVRSDAEFAVAVSALRDSGGTIVLLPHVYGDLVVPPRSSRPLRIEGTHGVRVERILLDLTQNVSIGGLTIAPRTQDAWIELRGSEHVDLHDLVVTARGTPHFASVVVPDSVDVAIRRSTFTHCGDRSAAWSNCLLLDGGARHVTIENDSFHDCLGCDFVHGRFGSDLRILRNRFERTLPCRIGRIRCGHQDLIELFAGQGLRVEGNHFGVYRFGGAQFYITGPTDHVRVFNNVFVGTDPRVPGYESRIGVIVGSRGSRRLPHDVRVVNNTILTGATRLDGYDGSIRVSSLYGGMPRRERPIFANNVIGILANPWPVCLATRAFASNVVARGTGCSFSVVGDPGLDANGRPTAASSLVVGAASRRYAPRTDITGRRRDASPDVGAYEYHGD